MASDTAWGSASTSMTITPIVLRRGSGCGDWVQFLTGQQALVSRNIAPGFISVVQRSGRGANDCCWPLCDLTKRPRHVRFSNRPFGVKRFQTIHHLSVSVARGLVLLFGIGTKALPSWDSKTRWNNLPGGLAVSLTGVQADMRTHLIHRPARDIIPPLGGARVFSYRI